MIRDGSVAEIGNAGALTAPIPVAPHYGHEPWCKTAWLDRGDKTRPKNAMRLISYWWIPGNEEHTIAILSDYTRFSQWWYPTFFRVDVEKHGENGLVGSRGRIYSQGFLPYTLCWTAEAVSASPDHTRIVASGDIAGTGEFRRPRAGEPGNVVFDWDVAIESRLLKPLCPWLRPLYFRNHSYAMAQGAKSLSKEVQKREARLTTGVG
ncbi:MAG: hypothetical protein AAF468_03900 [Pseudomonadota bacterium]